MAELRLHENWNHGTEAAPHIGSIMLAPELLSVAGVFALLESGCREVWVTKDGAVLGIEAEDDPERTEALRSVYADRLRRCFGYRGTAGDRNRHAMTGRVV